MTINHIRNIIGLLMILGSVWLFFYSFHIWPTSGSDFHWWTVPHLITTIVVCFSIIAIVVSKVLSPDIRAILNGDKKE